MAKVAQQMVEQYDLQPGENLYPRYPRWIYLLAALPRLRQQIQPLQTYPVRVVDGELQVGFSDLAKAPGKAAGT